MGEILTIIHLSRLHLLLFQSDACILGFEHVKVLYVNDEGFRELYAACLEDPKDDFLMGTYSKVHTYEFPRVAHVNYLYGNARRFVSMSL